MKRLPKILFINSFFFRLECRTDYETISVFLIAMNNNEQRCKYSRQLHKKRFPTMKEELFIPIAYLTDMIFLCLIWTLQQMILKSKFHHFYTLMSQASRFVETLPCRQIQHFLLVQKCCCYNRVATSTWHLRRVTLALYNVFPVPNQHLTVKIPYWAEGILLYRLLHI